MYLFSNNINFGCSHWTWSTSRIIQCEQSKLMLWSNKHKKKSESFLNWFSVFSYPLFWISCLCVCYCIMPKMCVFHIFQHAVLLGRLGNVMQGNKNVLMIWHKWYLNLFTHHVKKDWQTYCRTFLPSHSSRTLKFISPWLTYSSSISKMSFRSIPMSCNTTQPRVISHPLAGVVLRPLWRQANLFFKIPNVCSIKTLVLAWHLLNFSSDGVEG